MNDLLINSFRICVLLFVLHVAYHCMHSVFTTFYRLVLLAFAVCVCVHSPFSATPANLFVYQFGLNFIIVIVCIVYFSIN